MRARDERGLSFLVNVLDRKMYGVLSQKCGAFHGHLPKDCQLSREKPPRIIAFTMGDYLLAETLRDLIQCVQAARDGASDQSLFAMQCDLVLRRAAQVVPGALVPRRTH
jgi:hypothetical protein